jgi:hypothetical protein
MTKTELTLLATAGAFNWTERSIIAARLYGTPNAQGRALGRSSGTFRMNTSSNLLRHCGR